ncbi:MAG: transposase [Saprospiraceae bacterium]|nr:transposase [Saprospiraceae bacterium]
MLFSIQGRINFENLSRFSFYDESTFRRRFSQFFDWLGFNQSLIESAKVGSQGQVIAVTDCSFISKSGKHTFGLDKFWSGCLGKAKKGLEISVLGLIDVFTAKAWVLDVTQTPADLSSKEEGKYTRINFYIEQILDCLPHLTSVLYFVADGFYAKKKIFDAFSGMNKHLITKLRPDANLMFKFEGTHEKRKGAKNKYESKAVYDDLSRWHLIGNDAKYDYLTVYNRICYSPQFDIWLSVILVFNTKTKQYILLASTDLAQNPLENSGRTKENLTNLYYT